MWKNDVFLGLVSGVLSALLANHVMPFKSHFLLGILLTAGIGALIGILWGGIRKIVGRKHGKSSAVNALD
jgi:hypothetical protein